MNHFLILLVFTLSANAFAADGYVHCYYPLNSEADPLCLRVQSDIEVLAQLEFSAPSELHKKYFGGESGAIARYVTRNLTDIWVAREQLAAKPGEAANLASAGGSGISFHPTYFSQSLSDRLAVLVHEARHTARSGQENPHQHAICPAPYVVPLTGKRLEMLEGLDGCDESADGSYGYSFVFAASLYQSCVSCGQEMKAAARYAALEALYHINDLAALNELKAKGLKE